MKINIELGLAHTIAGQYRTHALPVLVKTKLVRGSKPRQCYDNAYHYCAAHPGSVYVVGLYVLASGIPIEHAWVRVGQEYFDVTLHDLQQGSQYFSLYELDSRALAQVVIITESPPGLYECSKHRAQPNNNAQ